MPEKNLIPMNERTKEEQREIAIKGGIASGKARQKKKALKDAMQMILALPILDKKSVDKMIEFGIAVDNMDNRTRLVYALYKRACTGDVAAIKEVRSLTGEDVSGEAVEKVVELIEAIKDEAIAADKKTKPVHKKSK